MSERVETFVRLCRVAIVKIADPAQLERYLRAAVAEAFPVGESPGVSPEALRALPKEKFHGGINSSG